MAPFSWDSTFVDSFYPACADRGVRVPAMVLTRPACGASVADCMPGCAPLHAVAVHTRPRSGRAASDGRMLSAVALVMGLCSSAGWHGCFSAPAVPHAEAARCDAAALGPTLAADDPRQYLAQYGIGGRRRQAIPGCVPAPPRRLSRGIRRAAGAGVGWKSGQAATQRPAGGAPSSNGSASAAWPVARSGGHGGRAWPHARRRWSSVARVCLVQPGCAPVDVARRLPWESSCHGTSVDAIRSPKKQGLARAMYVGCGRTGSIC